jgi:hypothetical protein
MAIHDPESTAQERQLALKIGRQKRIQARINYDLQCLLDFNITLCFYFT